MPIIRRRTYKVRSSINGRMKTQESLDDTILLGGFYAYPRMSFKQRIIYHLSQDSPKKVDAKLKGEGTNMVINIPMFKRIRQSVNGDSSKAFKKWQNVHNQCGPWELHQHSILKKKLIPERRLENRELDPLYERQIKERKWELFYAQPKGASVPLVLRGKTVDFASYIINVVYKTSWDSSNEYSTLKDQVDLEEVSAFLCSKGTTWTIKKSEHISIPKKHMSKEATEGFYYPSLVTSLCMLAGVILKPTEEIMYATSPSFIKLVGHRPHLAARPLPPPTSVEDQLAQLRQLVEYQGQYMSEMLQRIAQKKRKDPRKFGRKRKDPRKFGRKRKDPRKFGQKRKDPRKFGRKRKDPRKFGRKREDSRKFGRKRIEKSRLSQCDRVDRAQA
ncbi:hypothetical protein H6P81_015906 [Aristolochia fimbriata]|uniref:Uncharacterized protein n=1 Tax=Aristolochia fimbriata TaxID=158543 RepID=A0AAV7E9Q7_ARIFI|nr:hypothetical protein H6P81_015906 [Aristolochia fimbriata]